MGINRIPRHRKGEEDEEVLPAAKTSKKNVPAKRLSREEREARRAAGVLEVAAAEAVPAPAVVVAAEVAQAAPAVVEEQATATEKPQVESGAHHEKETKRHTADDPFKVIAKYRRIGVPDADIATNLKDRGFTQTEVDTAFRYDKKRATSRERRVLVEANRDIGEAKVKGATLGQVETTSGAAWKESSQDSPKLGREPNEVVLPDEGPLVQVETRIRQEAAAPDNLPGAGDEPAWLDTQPPDVDDSGVINPYGMATHFGGGRVAGAESQSEDAYPLHFDYLETERKSPAAGPQDPDERYTSQTFDSVSAEAYPLHDPVGAPPVTELPLYNRRIPREEYRDSLPPESDTPDTRKGWREKLAGLIDRAEQGLGNTTESVLNMSERGQKMSEYLHKRSAEIDAKAAETTKIERGFRWIGEKYNKLPLWGKIGIGATLGISAGISASFASPAAVWLALGIGAQRAMGMASTFNTKLADYEQRGGAGGLLANREKALLASALQFGSMSAAMFLLVEEAKGATDKIINHFSSTETPLHGTAAVAPAHSASAPASDVEAASAASAPASTPEAVSTFAQEARNAAATAVGEVASVRAPILEVTVPVSSGHGYEWMMKRVWEQLQQQQGIDSSAYPEGSDIRRLLEADASTIDKVVHQIASDPNHAFYNADGTSVRIDPTAHMSIGTDFKLHLSDATHTDMVHAAEGMGITPQYHPEVAIDSSASHVSLREVVDIPTPDASHPFPHLEGDQAQSVIAESPDQNTAPSATEEHIIVNEFNVKIPVDKPNLYVDTHRNICVFGGTTQQQNQLVESYWQKNGKTMIFRTETSGACRPLELRGGNVVAGPPLRTGWSIFSWETQSGPKHFKGRFRW